MATLPTPGADIDVWGPELNEYLLVAHKDDGTEKNEVVFNPQTGTTYTLVLTDAGKVVGLTNAGAITLTVPPNSSVAFPVGTTVGLRQGGAGQVTVTPGSGVTINSRGAALKIAGQYGHATLIKTAT